MADNVTIPAQGTGDTTPVVATDLVGGAHFQRMKLALGADGTAADASSGAGAVNATTIRTTLGSDDPAVADLDKLAAQVLDYDTGAGTANTAIFGIALPASGGPVAGGTATNPVVVTGPLTDTQLRATAVPVSGTVTTGGLTDTQLRATAVPVSLATLPALVAGSAVIGHVITDTGSTTAVTGTVAVAGTIAHDAADSGNPVKVGAKALSYGTNPTGVSNADRTDVYANVAGIPFMLAGHPNVLPLLANFTSAQTNTKLITVSAGTKIVMLSCTVAADHANTVDVQVRIGFAASTTPTTTGVYLSHPGIAPGAGIREAGMVAGADGDDVIITCEVPTGGSIDVVMKYFTIES